jgi:hypothetical protein
MFKTKWGTATGNSTIVEEAYMMVNGGTIRCMDMGNFSILTVS